MSESSRLSVVIIGSGNVATHMARRLDSQADILQICSPDIGHARALASSLGCSRPEALSDVAQVRPDADLYIVAVKDDAIADVARRLPHLGRGVAVHTSGSAPDDALAAPGRRHGVLYALQTFSRDKSVEWDPITIFTHASDDASLAIVNRAARLLSGRVREIDDTMRSRLHVAAVFACNFANYMWIRSEALLAGCGCDLTAFAPLLRETLDKALDKGPAAAQTGPARRGDTGIIAKHIAMLGDTPDAQLYARLSADIMNFFHEQN